MLRVLAMVAAQQTPPNWHKVDEHMTESIRLAEERGARPEQAVTHFRYSELLNRKGNQERAAEHLKQAATLFSQMEMTWWAKQAEALRGRIERGEPFKGFSPHVD